jgi:hypothetical protein
MPIRSPSSSAEQPNLHLLHKPHSHILHKLLVSGLTGGRINLYLINLLLANLELLAEMLAFHNERAEFLPNPLHLCLGLLIMETNGILDFPLVVLDLLELFLESACLAGEEAAGLFQLVLELVEALLLIELLSPYLTLQPVHLAGEIGLAAEVFADCLLGAAQVLVEPVDALRGGLLACGHTLLHFAEPLLKALQAPQDRLEIALKPRLVQGDDIHQ